jgi:hypothetical protein
MGAWWLRVLLLALLLLHLTAAATHNRALDRIQRARHDARTAAAAAARGDDDDEGGDDDEEEGEDKYVFLLPPIPLQLPAGEEAEEALGKLWQPVRDAPEQLKIIQNAEDAALVRKMTSVPAGAPPILVPQ